MNISKADGVKLLGSFGRDLNAFVNYQWISFLVLMTLSYAAIALGFVKPVFLIMALTMGVFDLAAILVVGSIYFIGGMYAGTFEWTMFNSSVFLVSIFLGHYLAAILHNAAHGNFQPNFLNRPVGELTGFLLSYGYMPFLAIHRLHHAFTDRELDPHSPKGKTMFQFLLTVRLQIFKQLDKCYHLAYEYAGEKPEYHKNWKAVQTVMVLNRALRFFLMIALLGPTVFLLFVLPCYLVNFLVFTIYNYKMHIDEESSVVGDLKLRNLNNNWYQKIINATCHGVLYHKNHHEQCGFFDPRDATETYSEQKSPVMSN